MRLVEALGSAWSVALLSRAAVSLGGMTIDAGVFFSNLEIQLDDDTSLFTIYTTN